MAASRARQFLGETESLLPHRHGVGAMEQSLIGGCTRWSPETSKGSATWATLVVTVFADIAPCNVLALSQPPGGLVPAIAFLTVFGCVSLYTARLVSYTMVFSGMNTLAEVWRDTIGSQTAWVPNVSVLLMCLACCVGLMTFYGSLFADAFGTSSENMWVVVLSLLPVSVMVMAKDISTMWFTSMIAGLSAIGTTLIVIYRAFDGSYEPGGRFERMSRAEALAQPHSVGQQSHMFQKWSRGSFQMVIVMSVMFLSHYNSAKYYRELSQQGREWYTRGVAVAMACSALTVLTSATAVSSTFRDIDPLTTNFIVDLYALDDSLVNFARVALAFGLMGSLTLMFSAMRESVIELLSEQIPTGAYIFSTVLFQNTTSLGLLALLVAITCTSTKGMDLTLFYVGRSALGAIVIYVIPGVIFLQSLRKYNYEASVRCETRCLVAAVMLFGVALAVCGFVIHTDPTFNKVLQWSSNRADPTSSSN